jgi:hypothetical protein
MPAAMVAGALCLTIGIKQKMGFFQSLFDANERDIKRYRKIVDKINGLEPQFEKLSDDELKNKTFEFRERVLADVGDTEGLTPKERPSATTAPSMPFCPKRSPPAAKPRSAPSDAALRCAAYRRHGPARRAYLRAEDR